MSLARHMGGWAVTRQRLGSSVGTAKAEGDGNENRGSSGPDATLSSAVALRPGRELCQTTWAQNGHLHPQSNHRLAPAPTARSLAAPLWGLPAALPLLTPAGLLDPAPLALAPGL